MGRTKWVAVAGGLAALAWSGGADAQHTRAHSGRAAAREHLYYDISEDPQTLELLALSDSGKVGGAVMMDVTDVHRSPKLLLGSTWRIACKGERMAIVHTTRVQPGSAPEEADVSPQPISARSSAKSWRVYQLACSGRGDLIERRVYRGELVDIVQRFWVG